jgi:hypothetical protein
MPFIASLSNLACCAQRLIQRTTTASLHQVVLLALAALLITACGGGGGVGEGGTGGGRVYASGVVTSVSDESIAVGGVEYDKRSAIIVDGFGDSVSKERLSLGSWIEVDGVTSDQGQSGTATTVQLRPSLRGTVSALDLQNKRFTVLSAVVSFDTSTVLAGFNQASDLNVGDFVEVHGVSGVAGANVQASRIERLPAPSSTTSTPDATSSQPYELRGQVSNLSSANKTMRVGGQKVAYDTARVTLNNTLSNGDWIRVSANAPPENDGRWSVQRIVNDRVLQGNVPWVYAEGVVSTWVDGPQFELEGLRVDAREAESRKLITGNNLRVAVVGSLQSGVLVAKAVRLIEPGTPVVFTVKGIIKKFNNASDFSVSTAPVNASQAIFTAGTAADLANGRKVRVTGVVQGQALKASTVDFLP